MPRLLHTVAALLVLSGCAKHGSTVESREPSDQEVLALSDKLTQIYKTQDLNGLRAFIAADYTGSAPGVLWDADTLLREFPKIHMRDIHRDAYFVKRVAPGALLLTEDATLSETYDGEDISGPYRMTTLWLDRGGRWQLFFEQELPIPKTADAPYRK